MSEVKRYEMIAVTRCGEGWQELQLEPEGDWIRFDDYAALEAKVERLRSVVINLLASAHPHPVEHPTMTAAWADAREALDATK